MINTQLNAISFLRGKYPHQNHVDKLVKIVSRVFQTYNLLTLKAGPEGPVIYK